MNKLTKNILYGIGTFAFVIVALAVIRSLTRGVPIENGFKETSNWLIAALSGACAGWSSYNKDLKKEQQEKKDKEQ